jgi:PIN domain nuclease of toxin-antitoxin system
MSSESKHPSTESVVIDAEPILTWVEGSNGATQVEKYLTDTYFGHINAAMSEINLAEVYYNCAKFQGLGYGEKKTSELRTYGVVPVDSSSVWRQASEYKHEYTPNFPLGDAFALATATVRDLPLLVGGDPHWDEPMDDGLDVIRAV